MLAARLSKAGFQTELVKHGLGFEIVLLAENAERAGLATQALLGALTRPVTAAEVPPNARGPVSAAPPSPMAACSGELLAPARASEAELERERLATFARDRAALAVVGDAKAVANVSSALAQGSSWPELGAAPNLLPQRNSTQVVHAEHALLSVALTTAEPDRAVRAAAKLGDPHQALSLRLGALGGGLRVRRVSATAHPAGGCLRIDSELDASPLPDTRRLGFAIHVIEEEAGLQLRADGGSGGLEATATSAVDPRVAARAAAYRALVNPETTPRSVRLVSLAAPSDAPTFAALEAAAADVGNHPAPLSAAFSHEPGQPGLWALIFSPCAGIAERPDNVGAAALWASAAVAATADSDGIRLEPWIGQQGIGVLGFVKPAAGEPVADAAARLGDALGRALIEPPSAVDVATARESLLAAVGRESRPLLDAVLSALSPGQVGALTPMGSAQSLQSTSREAVLARQRELARGQHVVSILTPTSKEDGAALVKSVERWLTGPEASRGQCPEPSRPRASEIVLQTADDAREGGYVGYRLPTDDLRATQALVELFNAPGGALARALSSPDQVGAARALQFGTESAQALVIQVVGFAGRQAEAMARVQRLIESAQAGGLFSAAEIEAALAKRRKADWLAALDPRFRLGALRAPGAPEDPRLKPVDAAALRRLISSLRPDRAVVARSEPRPPRSK